jgi:hypothetical protein
MQAGKSCVLQRSLNLQQHNHFPTFEKKRMVLNFYSRVIYGQRSHSGTAFLVDTPRTTSSPVVLRYMAFAKPWAYKLT